ncbi:hypothetical protein F2Q68_00017060 [Brassica cretica]|uniref:Uncharacterized protein n=1 Tax=Brassica cretica TaxID=69181 RepID=A0A8S9HCW2_BRACR|nr:hypothetical protein F2Q68_00017060 [Brassica cretica]
MDSSCWTCVSLNKNMGWRWREDGIWLAGLKSLSTWIGGWFGVRNRHKLGGGKLDKIRDCFKPNRSTRRLKGFLCSSYALLGDFEAKQHGLSWTLKSTRPRQEWADSSWITKAKAKTNGLELLESNK